MVILVKLIGIVITVLSAIYIVIPNTMKQSLAFWKKGKNAYIAGYINIVISIILLLAASRCTLAWFVTVLGIASLIKGIAIFALGPKKLTARINKIESKPIAVLRLFGLLGVAIGILLIYSA